MVICLQTGRVGPDGIFGKGDVIDVPEAEATRMIQRGYAVAFDPSPAEAMTAEPIRETATLKPRKSRKTRKNK